jgi:hypothetical protein
MMATYAQIAEGVVVEIIHPIFDEEGNEIAIGRRFHPDFVKTLVDVTNVEPPVHVGQLYADGAFSDPPEGLLSVA